MTKTECARCKGTEIYAIDEVCMEATDSSNGINPFNVVAWYGPSGEQSWMGEKNKRIAVRASARVCGSCGHTEITARDLDVLKKLAEKHDSGVRRL